MVYRDKIIDTLLNTTNTFLKSEDYLIEQEKINLEIGTDALDTKLFEDLLKQIDENEKFIKSTIKNM